MPTSPNNRPSPTLPPTVAAKILAKDALLAARAKARREGRRLVQCHGCFDIVHPGHIRHLRQARSLGDLLLVSITGDASISKGQGRPLIPEELRAENLAALDCVDFVHIDPNPTALALLEAVEPDVYVKGKEYESNNDPRFTAERDAVENAGGRVVFSSGEVVFSSTALIAAMEQSVDPYHQRLRQLIARDELQGPALFHTLSQFKDKRLLIVGETILDTYILCDRPDVAGESPILTLRPVEARNYDGGAAIIARHAAALGARPTLVTALPETPEGDALRHRLTTEGIEVISLPCTTPIPEKQRYLVGAQKVMKVDLVQPFVLDASQQDRLIDLARAAAGKAVDAAIITDFGLGLFSPRLLTRMCRTLRPLAHIMSGDVSGRRASLRAMRSMDLLCPSEDEARDAMRLHAEGLPLVAWRLLEDTLSKRTLITLGADGLIAFEPLEGHAASSSSSHEPTRDPIDDGAWRSRLHSEHIPALCPIAMDPLGCGDSLLTAATLALASGASLTAAAFLGSVAASVQVQRLGNIPITGLDLRQTIARVHAAHLTYAGPDAFETRRTFTPAPVPARAI